MPAPQRPIDYTEESLLRAILDGSFPAGSTLPGERDLATQLGVTRPTLREVLRRLEQDGWLDIQQGKPTRVNDFWRDGGPNILTALIRYGQHLPAGFVTHLLEVRLALAPVYMSQAINHRPEGVIAILGDPAGLPNTPEAFAAYDWQMHRELTILSGNPIYPLILNGFAGFYEELARLYFARPESRLASRHFYHDFLQIARQGDSDQAAALTRQVMAQSIEFWQRMEREIVGL